MRVAARLAVLAPIITLAVRPLYASASSAPDSTRHIGEVVVRAASIGATVPGQRLAGSDLRRLQNHSVADALRFFAGVQLRDYGGVGGVKTINIRSMGSAHVGVVFDGVQLGNAQNGQIDLGQFSLDNVESIDLYNGQKSGIFQSAKDFGCAGTIYLTTAPPRFAPGRRYSLRATMRGGSFGLVSPSLLASVRLADRLSATVSAQVQRAHGRYEFRYRRVAPSGETVYDTTAVRHNGDVKSLRTEAALFGTSEKHVAEWMIKGYVYRSRRGIPGAIVSNVWRRGERQDDDTRFLQGRLTLSPAPVYRARLLAKAALYRTHYVNRDTTQLPVDNRYRQRELYASVANLLSLNALPLSFNLSADVQHNAMEADLYDFARPRRTQLMLSAAVAHEWRRLKAQASCVATRVVDETVDGNVDKTGAAGADTESKSVRRAFTPAVVVGYQACRAVTVRAFAKRSFRMPTFNDLYYADMGNARLSPETTTQFNVGATGQMSINSFSLSLSADVYRNIVSDKIIAYPKGTQFRWTMLNLGRVDIRGADCAASLGWRPAAAFASTIRAQYTFQKAVDVTSVQDPYYRHQIPYIPLHSGSVRASLNIGGWQPAYAFTYVGRRYSQQENTVYNLVQPWYTSDASLQRTFLFARFNIRLLFEVNNLLGQDYDVILNYPMPGRNFRGALTVEF